MTAVELSVSHALDKTQILPVKIEMGGPTMYAFAAISMLGAWYLASQVHHVAGMTPSLLLAGALLSIAMHVLRRSLTA